MFNFRVGGRRRQADKGGSEAPPPAQDDVTEALPQVATHEAAGRAQEVIRAQLADLSQRHLVLRQAGDTLEGLERSVMQLLSDHQRARLASDGSQNELAAEREQHTRLRQEFARLQDEAHGHKQARLQLETALDNLEHGAQNLGAELSDARREQASAQSEAAQLRGDLSEALARAGDAEEKVGFYKNRFEDRQAEIAALDAKLKKELQQNAVLAEETRALQEALENLNRTLARRDREYAAAQQGLEQAAARHTELENALANAQSKHEAAEEDLREALEDTRAKSGSTTNKLDAMASRLQVTEQLLSQAREEIRERTEEHSAAQRQVLQVSLERNSFEKRIEETRKERDRADRLAKETSEINARLAERSHTLVASLKTRDREHEVAKQKLIAVTEELAQARAAIRTSEQQFQAHVVELNAQIAHERSSRQMADGSLEAARATVDSLRQEVARLRHISSDEAPADDASGQTPQRLPVAAQLINQGDSEARSQQTLETASEGEAETQPQTVVAQAKPDKSGGGAARRNGSRNPTVVIVKAEETERLRN